MNEASLIVGENVKGFFGGSLPFGVYDTISERISDLSLASGANTLAFSSVPDDEIHVLTNCAMRYDGTTPTEITFRITGGGSIREIFQQLSPTTSQWYDRQTWIVIPSGENAEIAVTGATLNDDLRGSIIGFIIKLKGQ